MSIRYLPFSLLILYHYTCIRFLESDYFSICSKVCIENHFFISLWKFSRNACSHVYAGHTCVKNDRSSIRPKFEARFLFKARKKSNTRGNQHEPVHKTRIFLAYKCTPGELYLYARDCEIVKFRCVERTTNTPPRNTVKALTLERHFFCSGSVLRPVIFAQPRGNLQLAGTKIGERVVE